MGYFRELHGIRSPEFFEGVVAGMTAYAVWRDGTQWVGDPAKSLKVAIEEARRDLLEHDDQNTCHREEP